MHLKFGDGWHFCLRYTATRSSDKLGVVWIAVGDSIHKFKVAGLGDQVSTVKLQALQTVHFATSFKQAGFVNRVQFRVPVLKLLEGTTIEGNRLIVFAMVEVDKEIDQIKLGLGRKRGSLVW